MTVLRLSQKDLDQVKVSARQGTTEALENVGLFARTPEEITARRAEFAVLKDIGSNPELIPYLKERFRLSREVKRKFAIAAVGATLIGVMLLIRKAPLALLVAMFGDK